MRMRFKYGPTISASVIRPVVVGEKNDPEVNATIDRFEPGDPGMVHMHLSVAVGESDPDTSSKLLAVHAIAFQPGDAIPSDPQKALQSPNPQGSVVATREPAGYVMPLVVKNIPEGLTTVKTVLVFDDDPAPTAPATTAAPATPSDPATPVDSTPATDTPPAVEPTPAPTAAS